MGKILSIVNGKMGNVDYLGWSVCGQMGGGKFFMAIALEASAAFG
jgi:hypothetical protein